MSAHGGLFDNMELIIGLAGRASAVCASTGYQKDNMYCNIYRCSGAGKRVRYKLPTRTRLGTLCVSDNKDNTMCTVTAYMYCNIYRCSGAGKRVRYKLPTRTRLAFASCGSSTLMSHDIRQLAHFGSAAATGARCVAGVDEAAVRAGVGTVEVARSV